MAPFPFDRECRSDRIAHSVQYVDRLSRFHDEPVADAIVSLEHHHGAGFLVGQLDAAAAETVLDDFACLEDGEYVADRNDPTAAPTRASRFPAPRGTR